MRKDGSFDVIVVGAGIFGLACAHAAIRTGRSVCILEAEHPGAAASGGIVGALCPHLPQGWSEKKQAQLAALAGAEAYWRDIAATSGRSPGYGRCGRYVPLLSPEARAAAEAQAEAALAHWPEAFAWRVLAPQAVPDCFDRAGFPFGAIHDTLSARIAPRSALAALIGALEAAGAELRWPAPVLAVEPGAVHLEAGSMKAQAIVLAAGTGGAALLDPVLPGTAGESVKGQAALLRPGTPPPAMVYGGGLYIVPHEDGTVAVGSTSERRFDDPRATDDQLDALVARARALCPRLAAAEVVECWAAVRPRAPKADPLVGPVPGWSGVYLANGGFRIGLGIAPLIGSAIARMIDGKPHGLPARFLPEGHGLARPG